MSDQVQTCDAPIVLIRGDASTGKTETLLKRCAFLLRNGVDPRAICVVVSTQCAAQALSRRLLELCGAADERARAIQITTAQQALVKSYAPCSHILNAAEEQFIIEDLVDKGHERPQVKTVLRRIRRAWSLEVPYEKACRNAEELACAHDVVRHLQQLGALLPEQAISTCTNALAKGQVKAPYAYVLCDDYQNLTKAQQHGVTSLYSTQLMVAGCAHQATHTATSWPYPEGLDELAAQPSTQIFDLTAVYGNPHAIAFSCEITGTLQPPVDPGTQAEFTISKWRSAHDEQVGICKYVDHLIKTDANVTVFPEDICIIVPNAHWAQAFSTVLAKHSHRVSTAGISHPLAGNPRTTSQARALRAYELSCLAADPSDALAWRCLIGIGDKTLHAREWSALLGYAHAQNLGIVEALEDTRADSFEKSGHVIECIGDVRKVLEAATQARGLTLAHLFGMDSIDSLHEFIQVIDGDESAEAFFRKLDAYIASPYPPDSRDVLRLTDYEGMCGCRYDHLIIVGAVEGLMPHGAACNADASSNARETARTLQKTLFANAVCRGRTVRISQFERMELARAEKLHVPYGRTCTIDNVDYAIARPSSFIKEAATTCPTTDGGQTLMAQLRLT